MKHSGTLPEMQELSEQVGEFVHHWGFKRVHGRIWTHLYVAQKPLDAADLVRQMKISKALVSISLRELLEYQVIEEVGKSARGTHLYRTNPDVLKVALAVLRQREKRILSRIHGAQEALVRTTKEDRAAHGMSEHHVAQLGQLVQQASEGLERFLAFGSVDFGDWRKAFITTNLEEEAALRLRSVVTPAPRRTDSTAGGKKLELDFLPDALGTEENKETDPQKNESSNPVLSSGNGIGFRIY